MGPHKHKSNAEVIFQFIPWLLLRSELGLWMFFPHPFAPLPVSLSRCFDEYDLATFQTEHFQKIMALLMPIWLSCSLCDGISKIKRQNVLLEIHVSAAK